MIFRIGFGSKPGEKKIGEGYFVCALCKRKRQYEKFLLQKRFWILTQALSPLSMEDLGEFVVCKSCLKPFSPDILEPAYQLQAELIETVDSVEILNRWKEISTSLKADELFSGHTNIVEVVSPYLKTVASNMRSAGVPLRLGEFEEARKFFVANIMAGIKWQEFNIRQNFNLQQTMPLQHQKMVEFAEASHLMLSLLP